MTVTRLFTFAASGVILMSLGGSVLAQGFVKARLSGYEEVPPVSTEGRGIFVAKIDRETGEIDYELTYEGLEGLASEAYIWFGQPGVIGDVIATLCSGDCPTPSGTVTGTIMAGDILGPAAQGIDPGDLEEALMAILSGVTYVNVHTDLYTLGEIRGQIRRGFARIRGGVGSDPPGLDNAPGQNGPPGHNDPPGRSDPPGHNDPPGNGKSPGRNNPPGQDGP